ncbi:sensor histidine kinase [Mycobacterium angelicum]|uniref:sensor histidine kinase n=1 Tax=Mycobacterium angelicum TaxID=470074 RepID=UPI001B80DDE7|nr:ATP-binding protein [Mycobacterium angelicum]MCV7197892.1 sensor histidine kinase [Mycobacterium angelicum]
MNASDIELERVRTVHQLRSYRIVAVLRVALLGFMVVAMFVSSPKSEWPSQTTLIAFYSFAALCALVLAYVPFDRFGMGRMSGAGRFEPFVFTIIDVVALTGFQLLSTDGIFPILIMTLLPVLVGLDVSSRRAAVVLTVTLIGFAIAGLQDRLVVRSLLWPDTGFLFALYAFLCCIAMVAVRIEERRVRSVAALSALREELLAETMTATEVLQRRISEAIHDGPLQDVLVARQELVELETAAPGDERVGHALVALQSASERLRQATFELHPAVLAQVGLGAAVQQLAAFTAARSGIEITTDIDYPVRSANDPILFGVARELLSNVVRHSHAKHASVSLAVSDGTSVLDIADDGVGVSDDTMARRLGQGHIGLASHRARVDAARGILVFMETSAGTRVLVELPLRCLN